MDATSTFQKMMNKLTNGLAFANVYLDDVFIFSKDLAGHAEYQTRRESRVKSETFKCGFARSSTSLLGHVVNA